MASHHHSCCRWLVASLCPCQQEPPSFGTPGGPVVGPTPPAGRIYVVPAHLVTEDIIFRGNGLCLTVGPNSQVVCEIDPDLMTVVEDVSDQFETCDECCFGLEACCDEFGDCEDLTVQECLARGKTPQGKGTECANTECPVFICPVNCPDADYPELLTGVANNVIIFCSNDFGPCELPTPNTEPRLSHISDFCNWLRVEGFGAHNLPCFPSRFWQFERVIKSDELSVWIATIRLRDINNNDMGHIEFAKPCLGLDDDPLGLYETIIDVSWIGGQCEDPTATGTVEISVFDG